MNFKLLALITFATAVIAAPASDDAATDIVHTQAGTTSHSFEPFADPQVNAEARGLTDYYGQSSQYQSQPSGYGRPSSSSQSSGNFKLNSQPSINSQPSAECAIPQCCQPITVSNQSDKEESITMDGLLSGGQTFDLGSSTNPFSFSCQPMTGACPSTPVCCSQSSSAGSFSIGCVPAIISAAAAIPE